MRCFALVIISSSLIIVLVNIWTSEKKWWLLNEMLPQFQQCHLLMHKGLFCLTHNKQPHSTCSVWIFFNLCSLLLLAFCSTGSFTVVATSKSHLQFRWIFFCCSWTKSVHQWHPHSLKTRISLIIFKSDIIWKTTKHFKSHLRAMDLCVVRPAHLLYLSIRFSSHTSGHFLIYT